MDRSIGDDRTIGPGGKPGGHAYALKVGDRFGQYRVIRALGAGGMGEVYEVEHEVLRRKYALKLLPSTLDWQGVSLERFRREAQVMANLDHPNILKVDEFGEVNGRYWLRMELAEGLRDETGNLKGVSLQDLAEAHGGKIPQEELLPILKQILEGLNYAHKHGAIHRDLKPSNILLSSLNTEHRTLNTIQAKISDFGLVRLVGEDWVRSQAQLSVQRSMSMGDQATLGGKPDSSEGTSTRALLGTYEYMSPEQKRGEEADERSDLYAVGMMTFRLLTGRNPGTKPPSRIDKTLVEGWDDFVEQALEEERDARLASALAGLRLLDSVAGTLKQKTDHERAAIEKRRLAAEEAARAEARRKAEERKRRAEEEKARQAAERDRVEAAPEHKKEASSSSAGRWFVFLLLVAGGLWWWAPWEEEPAVEPAVPVQQEPARPAAPAVAPPARPSTPTPVRPTARPPDLKSPWENSLGMKFNPVPGTDVLFAVWETRVQDYQRFVDATRRSWSKPSFEQGPTHPAVNVSWDDAVAFCTWLTTVERDAGVIGPNQAYRLPRDWEWSVAVGLNEPRAGSPRDKDAKIQNVYPWNQGRGTWPPPRGAGYYGSSLNVDSYANTSPVGSFDVNAHGLYDLGGNVWEWCDDFYDGNSGSRVLRGGSWFYYESWSLLSSNRISLRPGDRLGVIGFRVVLGSSSPR